MDLVAETTSLLESLGSASDFSPSSKVVFPIKHMDEKVSEDPERRERSSLDLTA
jgi:hypothetical protein